MIDVINVRLPTATLPPALSEVGAPTRPAVPATILAPSMSSTISTNNLGAGKIAFHSRRDGNWEIYVMNPDGTDQTRLTHNEASNMFPDWSPDGTRITFHSRRDGNWEIYMMNSNGTGQTRLTFNEAADQGPHWSLDGHQISFQSQRDGNWEIYVMNPTALARLGSPPMRPRI